MRRFIAIGPSRDVTPPLDPGADLDRDTRVLSAGALFVLRGPPALGHRELRELRSESAAANCGRSCAVDFVQTEQSTPGCRERMTHAGSGTPQAQSSEMKG